MKAPTNEMFMFSLVLLRVSKSGQLNTHHTENDSEGFPKGINKRERPHCAYVHVCVFIFHLYLKNDYQNTQIGAYIHVCLCAFPPKAHIHSGNKHVFPGRGWGRESSACFCGLVPSFSTLRSSPPPAFLESACVFQDFRNPPPPLQHFPLPSLYGS